MRFFVLAAVLTTSCAIKKEACDEIMAGCERLFTVDRYECTFTKEPECKQFYGQAITKPDECRQFLHAKCGMFKEKRKPACLESKWPEAYAACKEVLF